MEVLHYFGAALGLGLIVVGAGLGIGRLAAAAADGIARQPEATDKITGAVNFHSFYSKVWLFWQKYLYSSLY
ncbi:MAG: hypothetical protein CM1200mP10_10590 [Candidatus Neomarinimicrobiota bacterium]|nr:MAG: hypothetical protein CM1200mP10_10590 [Candidatus Neomarinimicrobiota bacterium]